MRFSAPKWLRDLGFGSWLLVGFVLIIVGVIAVLVGGAALILGVPLAGTIAVVTFAGAYVPFVGAAPSRS